MLKKGRKREAKGLAVLYFVIGLIILMIILTVIWFALAKLDYSDKLDPGTTVRPYVEQTEPEPLVETPTEEGEPAGSEDEVDLTVEVTEAPTPEPTEEPTPEPTEAPTPEPTPEPTALPADRVAVPMTDLPNMPALASDNGMIGITNCYVSSADDNKLMYVTGYGYVNEEAFDGAQAKSWLVVTQVATGQNIAYPLTLTAGVSGLPHPDAVCQNATSSDFEIVLDVSPYQEGIYSMAMVIGYVPAGEKKVTYRYYPFSGDVTFNVLNGQVIKPINAVSFE